MASMTDRICAITLRKRAFLWWWIAFVPCMALTLLLLVSIAYLFYAGIGIWGVSWPVAWGFAILSYVWWIAIASGGTIISALFFLVGVEWRTSINRIAESMMLFGAAAAGVYPILHLGRPWFAYWLFFYPNTMTLWAQFRSPLLWDFWALYTYVLASVLFWYLGLLPDLASVRDRATSPARQVIYGLLACGFRGSRRQWKHLHATYGVMAAIMAPVVVSIHSIVGLDFAGGATVGWHSTEFPPFFVFGALLSGFAIVLLLIIPLRRLLALEDMITGRHFDVLCKLLLTSSLCMAYAYIMDVFTTYYGGDRAERVMFTERMFGYYMAGLLGDDPVQRLTAAVALVRAVAHEPGGHRVHLPRCGRRHVAGALRDRSDQPSSAAPSFIVGRLPRHVLGLGDAARHRRHVSQRHSAGGALRADHLDARNAGADRREAVADDRR